MGLKSGVKNLAKLLCPVGSRRRSLLQRLRARAMRKKTRPLLDPWNLPELRRFLAGIGVSLDDAPTSAVRRYLLLLLETPGLHRQFPTALSGDPAFADWVMRTVADPDEKRDLLSVAGERPGAMVLHYYDHDPSLRLAFPLAMTPAGWGSFAYWLVRHRIGPDLGIDSVLWFLLERAEDPTFGIEATYRRAPEWQSSVPDGLGERGWESLKTWVGRKYPTVSPWIDRARRPASATETSAPGVNLLAHVRYPSGLQVAALNTVESLNSAGIAVSVRDVPASPGADLPGREGWLGLHPHSVTLSQLAPDPIREDGYPRAGLWMRPGVHRIGYWYWELEEVPSDWVRHSSWLDELWAPTRFIGEALRKAMPMPVFDMLAGIRMPPVVVRPRSAFGLPEDRFLFLFAFDMCSTFERKNPLAVVRAFRKAFRRSEPVALAIKVSRGSHDPDNFRILSDLCEREGVHLIDRMLPHEELHALMNSCDAYVSLHRSEGYGLTLAEAMALGKPAIATGYSGNLDFMDAENSFLVGYERVTIAESIHVYSRGSTWAEPDIDGAAEAMRQVVDDPALARRIGERGRQHVREKLSIVSAGQRMADRLAQLGVSTAGRRAA